jgi:hypothetical protein
VHVNDNEDIKKITPIELLHKKYSIVDDFFIDNDIKNVLIDTDAPKLLQMFEPQNLPFMNSTFNIELDDELSVECPVYLHNINLIVQNLACNHYVSMNSFVKQKTHKCPLCRADWEKENSYISDAKMYKIQMKDREKNLDNELIKSNNIKPKTNTWVSDDVSNEKSIEHESIIHFSDDEIDDEHESTIHFSDDDSDGESDGDSDGESNGDSDGDSDDESNGDSDDE